MNRCWTSPSGRQTSAYPWWPDLRGFLCPVLVLPACCLCSVACTETSQFCQTFRAIFTLGSSFFFSISSRMRCGGWSLSWFLTPFLGQVHGAFSISDSPTSGHILTCYVFYTSEHLCLHKFTSWDIRTSLFWCISLSISPLCCHSSGQSFPTYFPIYLVWSQPSA